MHDGLEVDETRRTVTVLFCDLVDSTGLAERLDPEAYRSVLGRFYAEMRAPLEHHGGMVAKFIGDAVMAVFGVPVLHEDDALRALRAATDMRDALEALNAELERRWAVGLQIRTGVSTGEVVGGGSGEGAGFVVGDAVNVAARLQTAAGPGEILLTAETHRLVAGAVLAEPVGPLTVKGKSATIDALRLHQVVRSSARDLRDEVDLVGRGQELAALEAAWAEALTRRRCRVVTVVGEAGIGKTRLARELERRVAGGATVLHGRCPAYGEGSTLGPVAAAVRALAGISATDTGGEAHERLTALFPPGPERAVVVHGLAVTLGLADAPLAPEQVSWSIRTALETLARRRPLLVVLDDVQWAHAGLVDLVLQLVELVADAPCLVVCLARPEPADATLRLTTTSDPAGPVIALDELDAGESAELVGRLLELSGGPASLSARVLERAHGNPLYLEEYVAMLADDPGGPLDLPPTIGALVAARLDRLDPRPLRLLERAAVVGHEFSWAALGALSPGEDAQTLSDAVDLLVRAGFVRADDEHAGPEDLAYRFHHAVIRDVVYRGMLRQTRAVLHERVADWLGREGSARVAEDEPAVAHHLEEALRHLEQLGPADDHQDELRERAARRLAACGERELARGDMRAAANLFGRGVEVQRDAAPARRGLELRLGVALTESGALADAGRVLAGLVVEAVASGEHRLAARARVERALADWRRGALAGAEMVAVARSAIAVLEEVGDDLGLARALSLEARALGLPCRYHEQTVALERALAHARRAGDRFTETDLVVWLLGAWQLGPMPATEAIDRIEGERARVSGPSLVTAAADVNLSVLHALRGDAATSRRVGARGHEELQRLGATLYLAAATQQAGMAERLLGDLPAAERQLRAGHEALGAMGEQLVAATSALLLADVLLEQGRGDEAAAILAEASPSVPADDADALARLRLVHARLLTRADPPAAVGPVTEALEIAAATDGYLLHVETLAAAVEVHRRVGDDTTAAALTARLLAAADRKGDRVTPARLAAGAR